MAQKLSRHLSSELENNGIETKWIDELDQWWKETRSTPTSCGECGHCRQRGWPPSCGAYLVHSDSLMGTIGYLEYWTNWWLYCHKVQCGWWVNSLLLCINLWDPVVIESFLHQCHTTSICSRPESHTSIVATWDQQKVLPTTSMSIGLQKQSICPSLQLQWNWLKIEWLQFLGMNQR